MSFVSEGQPDGKGRAGEKHDAYGEIVGSSWRPGAGVHMLLCGRDKSSQRRDIAKAKRMAKEFEGERAMKKAKANVTGNVKSNAKVTYAPFEVADYLDARRWRRVPSRVSKRSRP
jgi:hypothetical protein